MATKFNQFNELKSSGMLQAPIGSLRRFRTQIESLHNTSNEERMGWECFGTFLLCFGTRGLDVCLSLG